MSERQKIFNVQSEDFRGVGTDEVGLFDAVVELFDQHVSLTRCLLPKLVKRVHKLCAKNINDSTLVGYNIQWIPHFMRNG